MSLTCSLQEVIKYWNSFFKVWYACVVFHNQRYMLFRSCICSQLTSNQHWQSIWWSHRASVTPYVCPCSMRPVFVADSHCRPSVGVNHRADLTLSCQQFAMTAQHSPYALLMGSQIRFCHWATGVVCAGQVSDVHKNVLRVLINT